MNTLNIFHTITTAMNREWSAYNRCSVCTSYTAGLDSILSLPGFSLELFLDKICWDFMTALSALPRGQC